MEVRDIRGVNLGGWLVLERWITPSLFDGVEGSDEYVLSTGLPIQKAAERLQVHRNTFITEQHIKKIKKLGLNAVRVPVGYWLFNDVDGFIGGGYRYVDQLFNWATKHDIEVVLCLHGAPGSQNGWDHSGRAGEIGWLIDPAHVPKTLETLEKICRRYGEQERLFGIELLNEPHPTLPIRDLMSYYRRARRIIRQNCRSGVRWIVSDSFRPVQMTWSILLGWFHRPILDQHMYQLFNSEDRQLTIEGHINKAKSWYGELRWRAKLLPVIVGEWCAAMDEGYLDRMDEVDAHLTINDYACYAAAQRRSFERAHCGWFYWTARTEDRGPWSLLDHSEFLEN